MINLYDDEFVTSNPLGNKQRNSKVLGFYFTIANFSNKRNSKVENIFPTILTLSKYANKYSIETVLRPLIQDLKCLESDGITVNYEMQSMQFFGSLFLIISDNLAAHW